MSFTDLTDPPWLFRSLDFQYLNWKGDKQQEHTLPWVTYLWFRSNVPSFITEKCLHRYNIHISTAQKRGFEPLIPGGIPVFKTGAFNLTLPLLQIILPSSNFQQTLYHSAIPLISYIRELLLHARSFCDGRSSPYESLLMLSMVHKQLILAKLFRSFLTTCLLINYLSSSDYYFQRLLRITDYYVTDNGFISLRKVFYRIHM